MAPPRRSILITGCSPGGLGAALAEAFHNSGRWRVFASARNLKKLEGWPATATKGDDGPSKAKMEKVRLDICDDGSIKEAVNDVQSLLKAGVEGEAEDVGLDALCLNAGGGLSVSLLPAFVRHLVSNLWHLSF